MSAAPVVGSAPPLVTSAAIPVDDQSRWTSLTPGTPSNHQSFTTPRVGAVWEFMLNQTLCAQYPDSIAADDRRDQNGVALAAERARQVEVGWKQAALDGRLNTAAAVFELVTRLRASAASALGA